MSGVTEIYVCKNGQALKEGRLELSHSIDGRDDAEADAIRRCKIDGAIERIAYYAIGESGGFRNIFTYTNPNAGQKKPVRKTAVREPKRTIQKKKPEQSWLTRLVATFSSR